MEQCCRIGDFVEHIICVVRRTESWNGAAESEILQSRHDAAESEILLNRLIFLRPLYGFLRVSPWAVSLGALWFRLFI
jgi:hypothetical protein